MWQSYIPRSMTLGILELSSLEHERGISTASNWFLVAIVLNYYFYLFIGFFNSIIHVQEAIKFL